MNVAEFQHVSKKRKNFSIDNLNMTIPKGFITGFIGPNGSGKTTTIQMMMDVLQVDSGNITLFGEKHTHNQIKQKIGFVYDNLYMYGDFTIQKMKSFISPIYETWNEDLFQTYVKKFNLPLKKKIKHFSMGMKMKCSLLFALSHEPEFIIMDEPTTGLDPVFRRDLFELIQDLMIQDKQTIFLSTHMTTYLDQIADYIIFIYQGKIIFQKSMEEINDSFHIVKGKAEMIDADTKELFVGVTVNDVGFHGLFKGNPEIFSPFGEDVIIENASLEDIMYYLEKGGIFDEERI